MPNTAIVKLTALLLAALVPQARALDDAPFAPLPILATAAVDAPPGLRGPADVTPAQFAAAVTAPACAAASYRGLTQFCEINHRGYSETDCNLCSWGDRTSPPTGDDYVCDWCTPYCGFWCNYCTYIPESPLCAQGVSISRICESNNYNAILNTDYIPGTTADGTKFWHGSTAGTSGYYLYWNPSFLNWGARWILDDQEPGPNIGHAIYGHFAGLRSDTETSDPPFGQRLATFNCGEGGPWPTAYIFLRFTAPTAEHEGTRVHGHEDAVAMNAPDQRAITD